MSTVTTAWLALVKAVAGSKEPFNLATFNANMDTIDTAIGPKSIRVSTAQANNTLTETQMFGYPLPNLGVGTCWRLAAWGTYDHSATSTTLTFKGKIGGNVFAINALTTPASLLTARQWRFELELVVITTGAGGTCRPAFNGEYLLNTTQSSVVLVPSGTTPIDTTGSPTLEITAQWAAASASNICRCDAAYAWRISNT